MTTIIPDHWYIPPAVDAAAVRAAGGDADRLTRIAALDGERMADSLAFLSGYAPGVLDAILTATEPCLDDLFPAGEDALEGAVGDMRVPRKAEGRLRRYSKGRVRRRMNSDSRILVALERAGIEQIAYGGGPINSSLIRGMILAGEIRLGTVDIPAQAVVER